MRIDQHWDTCGVNMGLGCTCLDGLQDVGDEAERQDTCRPDFMRGIALGLCLGSCVASVCWGVVLAFVTVARWV